MFTLEKYEGGDLSTRGDIEKLGESVCLIPDPLPEGWPPFKLIITTNPWFRFTPLGKMTRAESPYPTNSARVRLRVIGYGWVSLTWNVQTFEGEPTLVATYCGIKDAILRAEECDGSGMTDAQREAVLSVLPHLKETLRQIEEKLWNS